MPNTEPRHLSEAILLAGLSAFSYALAYAYKSGISSHFGIPPLLISPTIGAVLQAATAVGFVVLTVWNIANAIWPFAPRGENILARVIRKLLVIAFFIGLLAFPTMDRKTAWIVFAVIVGFFTFFELAFPLITQRKIKGYEQKLLAQEAIEANAQKFSLLDKVAGTFGEHTIRLVALGLVLLMLSNLLGIKTAKEKTDFFVLLDTPRFVVVDMDDNTIVLAEYDPKTLTLTGLYQVEHFSDSAPRTFRLEHIGKLAAAPKSE